MPLDQPLTSAQLDEIVAGLNSGQRSAALHDAGPALALSGPGTGKTETMSRRLLRLYRGGTPLERMLTLTFTLDAAENMVKRLRKRLGDPNLDLSNAYIGTFHSIAGRLLRRRDVSQAAGISPHFKILGSDSERQQILFAERIFLADVKHSDLLAMFDRWKDRLMTPEQAIAESAGDTDKVNAAQCYARYQKALEDAGLMDFGDLIMTLVRTLRDNPALKAEVSKLFDHVSADEYQDINDAQYEMLRVLTNDDPNPNLWVVGDDDQSIFGFRGSDVRFIRDFKKIFPGAKIYELTENYRSTPNIIKFAKATIGQSQERLPKGLEARGRHAQQGPGPKIIVIRCKDEADEAKKVYGLIQTLKKNKGFNYADMAVMFRSANAAAGVQNYFAQRGQPYVGKGIGDFWGQESSRLMRGTLDLVMAIVKTGTMPSELVGALGKAGVKKNLHKDAYGIGMDLRAKLADKASGITPETAFKAAVLRVQDKVVAIPPVYQNKERRQQWIEAVNVFAAIAGQAGTMANLNALIKEQQAQAARARDEAKSQGFEGVNLTTAHSSKGLEWPVGIVIGVNEGQFPHALSTDIEEELRLLFVALTRPEQYVVVTFTESRHGRACKPSRFLVDALRHMNPNEMQLIDVELRDLVPDHPALLANPALRIASHTQGAPAGAGPVPAGRGPAAAAAPGKLAGIVVSGAPLRRVAPGTVSRIEVKKTEPEKSMPQSFAEMAEVVRITERSMLGIPAKQPENGPTYKILHEKAVEVGFVPARRLENGQMKEGTVDVRVLNVEGPQRFVANLKRVLKVGTGVEWYVRPSAKIGMKLTLRQREELARREAAEAAGEEPERPRSYMETRVENALKSNLGRQVMASVASDLARITSTAKAAAEVATQKPAAQKPPAVKKPAPADGTSSPGP